MSTVLQVGDIANVAADLASALETNTDWRSTTVAVSEVSRRSRIARVADLPRRALRTRAAVIAAVTSSRPDVVHLHWARYAPFIATRGVPLVIHVHGSDVRARAASLPGRLVTRAMAAADAVLVSTPDLLADVPAGARYLPNPVDTELFAPSSPEDHGFSPAGDASSDRPVVLLFARLNPIKGAERMVAAASIIRSLEPAVRVVAIAGGQLDQAAAAAGVELVPHRHRADLVGLIRSADVVVGQQQLGILSLSELESMACERPVVMPLRRDLYTGEVPVVDASDPSAVAQGCVDLLADPAGRRALGAAARRYVAEHHSPAAVAGALVGVYEGVA